VKTNINIQDNIIIFQCFAVALATGRATGLKQICSSNNT